MALFSLVLCEGKNELGITVAFPYSCLRVMVTKKKWNHTLTLCWLFMPHQCYIHNILDYVLFAKF